MSFVLFSLILILNYVYYKKECNKLYFTKDDGTTSLDKYIICTEEKLCDISFYGACPGNCYRLFSFGITFTAFFLFLFAEFRINIWGKIIYYVIYILLNI